MDVSTDALLQESTHETDTDVVGLGM